MKQYNPIINLKNFINRNRREKAVKKKQYQKRETLKQKINSQSQFSNKIFGIGLSRTGTKSLTIALASLGYKAVHWRNLNQILSFEDFYSVDVATDTYVSYQFETLYYLFPNSKFIYTVRNESNWVKSVTKHFNSEKPKLFKQKYIQDLRNNLTTGIHIEDSYYSQIQYMTIHDALYGRFENWLEAYRAHDERVRHFFQNDPERLLVMNITNGDGWEKLCNFLGKPIPKREFPKR